MDKVIIGFFIGSLCECFSNLSVEPIRRRWRRQCNYDCSKCKVWDCDRFYCLVQKEKENKKREGERNIK